jgi:hypothetical protein
MFLPGREILPQNLVGQMATAQLANNNLWRRKTIMSINIRTDNTEIIYKLLKTAAKQYGFNYEYDQDKGLITFDGPTEYQEHISAEVISYFKKSGL